MATDTRSRQTAEAEIFICLDGDDIGNYIELLLMDGRLAEAGEFSARVTKAMADLRQSLDRIPRARVCLFGGDDLIVAHPSDGISRRELDVLRRKFRSATGKTISAGRGESIEEAFANLNRAKLSGKDRIVGG